MCRGVVSALLLLQKPSLAPDQEVASLVPVASSELACARRLGEEREGKTRLLSGIDPSFYPVCLLLSRFLS